MLTKEAEKKPMRTNLRSVSKIFWCPKGLLKGNLQKASVLQGNRKRTYRVFCRFAEREKEKCSKQIH